MDATVSSADTIDQHHLLHTKSLPLIDLRFLSQSDLLSLSLCSSSLNNNRQNEADVATLKIDRSVFNESAGSRKQTFSKLRLVPRNSNSYFSSTPSIRTLKNFDFPQDEESSQIICLLKALFGSNFNSIKSDDVDCKKILVSDDDDDNLISVPITYNESFQALQNLAAAKNYSEEMKRAIATAIADSSGNRKRKKGRLRCSSSNNVSVNENENEERKVIVVEEEHEVSVVSDSKRKRGRPRKNWSNNVNVSEENQVIVVEKEGNVVSDTKRKKVREQKILSNLDVNVNVNEESKAIVVEEENENVVTDSKRKQGANVSENVNEREVIVVEEESGEVKVEASSGVEDWYGEELRRRTMGMQTGEEVLGVLEGLEGEWASKRKKRKIVDVSVLGDMLPKGWKLIVSNKRRAGYYWLDCSGFIRFLTNFIQDFILFYFILLPVVANLFSISI